MPPRPNACCRAIQRQPVLQPVPTWIYDDILAKTFQGFALGNRIARRYGSHIPGPLEARRRQGKRRMTQVYGGEPTFGGILGANWSFWDVDRTQWRWEAPTPREPETLPPPQIPKLTKWLIDLHVQHQSLQQQSQYLELEDVEESLPSVGETHTPERILSQLQDSLSTLLSTDARIELFHEFFDQFSRQLYLGLVSEETICRSLNIVTNDILATKLPRPKLVTVGTLLLEFYQSVWEGISSCQVLKPTDLKGETVETFLVLLSRVKMKHKSLCLAQKILLSVSPSQLISMETGIKAVIQSWFDAWDDACHPARLKDSFLSEMRAQNQDIESKTLRADNLLCSSGRTLKEYTKKKMALLGNPLFFGRKLVPRLRPLVNSQARPENRELDLIKVRENISRARDVISQAEHNLWMAELAWSHGRQSIKMLAESLINVPLHFWSHVVSDCSDDIIRDCIESNNPKFRLRYQWMSLLAHMPIVDENLFVGTWQKMEGFGYRYEDLGFPMRFNEDRSSNLILQHWISRGVISNPYGVKLAFDAISRGNGSFAALFLTLSKRQERSLARTNDFFRLATHLRRLSHVYPILHEMNSKAMKLPVTIFSRLLNILCSPIPNVRKALPEHALRIWNIHSQMYNGYATLRLESIPNMVIELVYYRELPSSKIWELLRIPPYKRLESKGRNRPLVTVRLSEQMVDLMHKMALAFAYAENRTPKSAVENIEQCIWHLRRHRAHIGPDISKALCHAVFTREIKAGNWIVTGRIRWALNIVERLEGKEAAEKMADLVAKWRRALVAKQEKEAEERQREYFRTRF